MSVCIPVPLDAHIWHEKKNLVLYPSATGYNNHPSIAIAGDGDDDAGIDR
jgi:hypothetical protein